MACAVRCRAGEKDCATDIEQEARRPGLTNRVEWCSLRSQGRQVRGTADNHNINAWEQLRTLQPVGSAG